MFKHLQYAVTVPQGYNSLSLKKKEFKTHTIKKDWFDLGLTTEETVFGNKVRTYNMERIICVILRVRNRLDSEIMSDSLKRYFERKDRDLNKLMEYAKELKIEKILRTYMVVLL